MTVASLTVRSRLREAAEERRKVAAFVRRDFLVAWSYRMSFVSDIVNLAGQVVVFYFVGRLVDPARLPAYGGTQVSYLEFAAVGIAMGVFMQFGLDRVAAAVRGEQLMGTLESVLVTPTAPTTIQFGSVAFDLLYVPVRTAAFLGAITLSFGLHFSTSGLLPALLLLLAFVPFVWGLGVFTAAALLTFRRGSGFVGLGVVALGLVSGVYFPLDLLPHWLSLVADVNPVAITIDGMRRSLLGDDTVGDVLPTLAVLVPVAAASLAVGLGAFRLAVHRERRNGTLGLY
jgi:ABC-2 type transport system permease protein